MATKLHKLIRLLAAVGHKADTLYLNFQDGSVVQPVAQAAAFCDGGKVELIAVLPPTEVPTELQAYFAEHNITPYGEIVVLHDDVSSAEYKYGRVIYVTDIEYGGATYPAVFEAAYGADDELLEVVPHGAQAKARKLWGNGAACLFQYVALILLEQDMALVLGQDGAVKPLTAARAYQLWSHYYDQMFYIRKGEARGEVYARSKLVWNQRMAEIDAARMGYLKGGAYNRRDALSYMEHQGCTYEEAVDDLIAAAMQMVAE